MRLNLTGTFLIAATAFTSSALAQVGADSCGQATPITGSGTRTPDIQFGVTTLDGQMSSCGRLDTFGDPLGQADVWYRYTAVSTGALQIGAVANVANRGIGVSVLSGCNGTELYCASNVSRTGNGPLIFPIVAGGSYLVRVTTYASMAFGSDIQTTIGNFNGTPNTHTGLVFTELPSIAGQPGASCANPRQVTASGSPYYFDNATAALNDGTPTPPCAGDAGRNAVWFSYVAQISGQATFTVGDASIGNAATNAYTNRLVVLSAYTSCGSAAIACSDSGSNPNEISFNATAGQTYRIRVAVDSNTVVSSFNGLRSLTITQSASVPNDICSGAVAVGPSSVNNTPASPTPIYWYDQGASANGPFPTCGLGSSADQRDVWFRYTATTAGTAAIQVGQNNTQQNFDTSIAVFDGTCGNPTQIACASRNNADRWWACFGITPGHSYLIRLSRPSSTLAIAPPVSPSTTTTARMFIREFTTPSNDSCQTAALLTPGVTMNWDNSGACDNEPLYDTPTNCLGQASAGLWYVFTPAQSGIATLTSTPTSLGATAVLQAFSGSCGGPQIGCYSPNLTVPVVAGTPVYVRLSRNVVDGNNNFYESGTLRVDVAGQIPGDECATAVPIGAGTTIFDNTQGTDNPADPEFTCVAVPGAVHDLWYSYVAPADGTLQVDTCGVQIGDQAYESYLSVYEANCGGALLACNQRDGNTVRSYASCSNAQSAVRVVVDAGVRYLIRVAAPGFGRGRVNVDFFPAAVDLLSSARNMSGSGPLADIYGSLPNRTKVNIYRFRVCDNAGFYATTNNAETNGLNTVLYLFNAAGHGVTMHDDLSSDTSNPTSFLTGQNEEGFPTGIYYLAITGGVPGGPEGDQDIHAAGGGTTHGRTPISSVGGRAANRQMWNPDPRTIERAPDGSGATGTLTGWTGLSGIPVYINMPWNYHIQLGGACLLCPADLDDGTGQGTPDDAIDINDLLFFLVQFENGAVVVDIDDGSGTGNPDGGVDINDLLYFLIRFEAGC